MNLIERLIIQNLGVIGFLMAFAGLGMIFDKFQLIFGIGLFLNGLVTFVSSNKKSHERLGASFEEQCLLS